MVSPGGGWCSGVREADGVEGGLASCVWLVVVGRV